MTFGGLPVMRADIAIEECRKNGIDTSSWQGKCNSYTNPVGAKYGEGWFLMRRADVQQILKVPSTASELIMTTGTTDNKGDSIAQLWVDYAYAATPTMETDDDTLYVVHCVDRRYLANRYPIRPSWYNIRSSSWPNDYFPWSRDQSPLANNVDADPIDWTWTTMFKDLWDRMKDMGRNRDDFNVTTVRPRGSVPEHLSKEIGSNPTFPNTFAPPVVNPENYGNDDGYFLDVLQEYLECVNLSLRYRSDTNTIDYVDTGAPDTDFANLRSKYQKDLIYDGFGLENQYLLVPGYVRTLFGVRHMNGDAGESEIRHATSCWDVDSFVATDSDTLGATRSQVDPDAALLISDYAEEVYEPQRAVGGTGGPADASSWTLNGDQLNTSVDWSHNRNVNIATERSQLALESLAFHGIRPTFKRLVYSGAKLEFQPGNKIQAVRWGNIGNGPFTEVVCSKSVAPKRSKYHRRHVYESWFWGRIISINIGDWTGSYPAASPDGWTKPVWCAVQLYKPVMVKHQGGNPTGKWQDLQATSITIQAAHRWEGVSLQPGMRVQVEFKNSEWCLRAIDCVPAKVQS
jgi:hypothetical protein